MIDEIAAKYEKKNKQKLESADFVTKYPGKKKKHKQEPAEKDNQKEKKLVSIYIIF